MTEPNPNELAERAVTALKEEEPKIAKEALLEALLHSPERVDLMHALAVTHLQLGEPNEAITVTLNGEQKLQDADDPHAEALLPQLILARAAAHEDLGDAASAAACYTAILDNQSDHPRALQALGHLQLAWGRTQAGLKTLCTYTEGSNDHPEHVNATKAFTDSVRLFIDKDVHPKMFLQAHRESYLEFFDHHASQMEAKGWIAEAARMHRDEQGRVVPIIPEGARPYAALRVDLVDPATGQVGQVGDQPMIVALADYEPLAQAVVLIDWPENDTPFSLWVSSQCPWDQLSVQVRFQDPKTDIMEVLDPIIGDWFLAGYDGSFGETTRGRFHYISDPELIGTGAVVYHVDCGRSELEAITDLRNRLALLHGTHPISHVVLGRGFLPTQ